MRVGTGRWTAGDSREQRSLLAGAFALISGELGAARLWRRLSGSPTPWRFKPLRDELTDIAVGAVMTDDRGTRSVVLRMPVKRQNSPLSTHCIRQLCQVGAPSM